MNDSDTLMYRRRVRAWMGYDWASSAFATTIMAAVLPVYYSRVAASTLPNSATATAYWSIGLSIALVLSAILSPILGTLSDLLRCKKRMLTAFVVLGSVSTSLLVMVAHGDWLLASVLFVFARVGFAGANVFYDALLPHVARPEHQDRVSAQGYALGYLGGAILLAINIGMISLLPGTWGARWSFVSVGVWWLVFTIPLLRDVPEPPADTQNASPDSVTHRTRPGPHNAVRHMMMVMGATWARLMDTFRHLRQYPDLWRFLLAFLIYSDGIGTIIGIATIYGAELGFGSTELLLALMLVQLVGIPFSLLFGQLPRAEKSEGVPSATSKHRDRRNGIALGFVLYNVIGLPTFGIMGRHVLPEALVGAQPPYKAAMGAVLGAILVFQAVGALVAYVCGRLFLHRVARHLDAKRTLLLSLVAYGIIAVWGFVLASVLEFWCLAWMVAVVQGGSQALSRSVYASMSPAYRSGEFFGLFSVMEKAASALGPLCFAGAVAVFGSSRPGVLSLVLFFMVGGALLMTVNIREGRALAQRDDARLRSHP